MKFEKVTDVCMTGGIRHTPSHTNVCKFFIFSADITPDMLKLCRVTKVKVLFLVLVYVFNFTLFEFSAATLEKGLLRATWKKTGESELKQRSAILKAL